MKLKSLLVVLLSSCLSSCNMTVGGVNLGAVSNVGKSLTQAGTIHQDDELLLGEDFAAMLLGAAPLHPQAGLQSYVNSVGRYLASQSSRPDLPWIFGVLDTPDINAFAVPGGYVFVTSGLLANLGSEAELAAVLAHEISHITERHQLVQLERDNTLNLMSNIASAVYSYREERNSDNRIRSFKNRQVTDGLLNAGQKLYTKGLSREDEMRADSLALRLTARAGYDPYAIVAVLQKLDSLHADSSGLSLMLATHPAPADRLNHLQQQFVVLEQQHLSLSNGKLQLEARYQQLLTRLH